MAQARLEDLSRYTGITSDSREAREGMIFVAVRGGTSDGHRFIADVAAQGATLVIGEDPAPLGLKVSYRQVADSRLELAELASRLHGEPSRSMLAIGVTGTSGKTTTTYVLESILKAAGRKVGVIGTVNFRFGDKIYPSTHTTPGPVELQKLLAEMRADGCDAVVMEVSSHALKQRRVHGVAFDGMVFTNLTPEHLDFHPDMEDYFQAKALLFTDFAEAAQAAGKRPVASINTDDKYGKRLLQEATRQPDFIVQGYRESEGALTTSLAGIRGEVLGVRVDSGLTGRFNAANLLGALTLARALGISPEGCAQGVRALPVVPGRLERVPNGRGIHVLVDYAHKPDALEKVLNTLREVRSGHRLITVFGCGGDRDRVKRPVMGRLAAELSDRAVVTSDNPRTEDPHAIIREITAGMTGFSNFTVQPDRALAIVDAVGLAQPGDLILIAGKGHEDYQIIGDPAVPGGTRKIHFDDREIAALAMRDLA